MAYEEIILDESILDLDAWLPEKAVEEILQAILHQDSLYKTTSFGKQQYITKNIKVKNLSNYDYINSVQNYTYYVQTKDTAA